MKYHELWDEVAKDSGYEDKFTYYKLNDFENIMPYQANKYYINYEEKHKQMITNIMKFLNKNNTNSETKIIALVGFSGSGKTQFCANFNQNIQDLVQNHQDKLMNNYEIPYSGWTIFARDLVSKNLLTEIKKIEKKLSILDKKLKKIIVIDDINEILNEDSNQLTKLETNTTNKFLERIERYSNCFIIINMTPYSWLKYNRLNFKYIFDDVIYLDGLNEQHLYEIFNQRIDKSEVVFNDTIKKTIIKLSNKNPKLMFKLTSEILDIGFKNKNRSINEMYLNEALKNLNMDTIEKSHLNEKEIEIITILTTKNYLTLGEISEDSVIPKTSINEILKDLELKKIVIKDVKNARVIKYTLPLAIRNDIEQKLMKEIMEDHKK